ncbi:hypothetical protein [Flavobacterium orientale]|uniref:Uncharacterized protein n=1 Tax=Flavobacterium orientale TaxID=1756020 RepID=A0A916Y8N4_9FLAO|nr:hypothetical protein [Flavobacterium orientale]GGD34335.1 hypothetical protein GCM10011343_25290 [Flavobacterium orientale]
MIELFIIKAKITFSANSLRTWPIDNGYKPLFDFGNDIKTSGIIKGKLEKGETSEVEIYFYTDEPFKTISNGTKFRFYEWPNLIGTGEINEIIGWSY